MDAEAKKLFQIESESFKEVVLLKCWDHEEFIPAEAAFRQAISLTKGFAKNKAEEKEVFLRVAKYDDDYILDLGNESGQVVKISKEGWEIVDDSPVQFFRPKNLLPMPTPAQCGMGGVDHLWELLNIPVSSRNLLLVVLCDWLRNDTAYPVIEITGEQGSGKSLAVKIIRSLIDANKIPLRSAPKSVQDFFVTAAASHVLTIENASKLSDDLQDAICSVSSGGGFSARKLYSDAEESALEVKRP